MFKINKNKDFYQNQDIFKILFEAIPGGIFIVDKDTNIVAVNAAAEKMFGYEKGELINQPKDILLPKRYLTTHKNQLNYFANQFNKGKNTRGLYLFGLTKNNIEFPLEISLNPFSIYEKEFIMALIIDMTVQRDTEKKIDSLNVVLEEKVKKGELGFKSGKGFQSWTPEQIKASRERLNNYLLDWLERESKKK